VVSSDVGFRAWLRSARSARLAEPLIQRFRAARLLASSPRAADSLRDIGLTEIWSTSANPTENLFRYLMAQPMRNRRVVVQSDNVATVELCHALRGTGAEVVEVPTYECLPPAYSALLRRLGDQVLVRQVDAVALIGVSAGANLVEQAIADSRLDGLLNTLTADVPALCLGGLSAAALSARGVPVHAPPRPYLDELVSLVVRVLPEHAVRVAAAGYRLEVRGQAVLLDGELIAVQPGPIAVLRALAQQPGRVLSYADIRRAAPNWAGADDHAIEMAVSRLRRSLHNTDLIQTVVKRGYRLAS
jgi:uroporphyrinogen-III synthase